jgi:hypothetical protein
MEITKEDFIEVGGQILVKRVKTGKQFTLRDAAKNSLLGKYDDEKGLKVEEKVKRFDIYLKVKDATDPTELTVDEVSLIKKLIAKTYGVLIVGQAVKMLEGK